MKVEGLVLAVLDTSEAIGDPLLSAKYRDLTISWSRYGYHNEIIEGSDVDGLLAEANQSGYRYCLIQAYGHIIQERWTPEGSDFFDALNAQISENNFLAIGSLIGGSDLWFGFRLGCLLINLETYRQLGRPAFGVASAQPVEVPTVTPIHKENRLACLVPGIGTEYQTPRLTGWHFISSSLTAGLRVLGLSNDLACRSLDLDATGSSSSRVFARYLGQNISDFHRAERHNELSTGQSAFLRDIAAQTAHARKGVFLWNIESYGDIEEPRDDFQSPVSTLYSVAAGFKPNRILQTHGFDETTRMVYGKSSGAGSTALMPRSARAPWPISRRLGPRMKRTSPTQKGGKL